jgi:mitogen-activated protein kinase 1/3
MNLQVLASTAAISPISPRRRPGLPAMGGLDLKEARFKHEEDEMERHRLTILRKLGSGAASVVWEAEHAASKKKYAVKKADIANVEEAKRALREIRLLRHFTGRPNIIHLLNLLPPINASGFSTIYYLFELCETDLHYRIHGAEKANLDTLRRYAYEMLAGVDLLHQAGVLHRDLKPSNMMITYDDHLKITDFGSGRGPTARSTRMTALNETTTVAYLAPEGLLRSRRYTSAVDVWSLGCVLLEMICSKRAFNGKHAPAVLELIFDQLGMPDHALLEQMASEEFLEFAMTLPPKSARSLVSRYPALADHAEALHLVQQMLVVDPAKRITVHAALEHSWIREAAPLVVTEQTIQPYVDSVAVGDDEEETMATYRAKLHSELVSFHDSRPPL